MKSIEDRKDRSVSEVIGTIFVFAIFIALLTTLVAWYIPSTETSADQNYEASMINAMSSITSTLSNPTLPAGTQINEILPTGIAGTVVSPSTPTSVAFSDSGFSENVSYGVGLGFYYLNQHPTSGVLNKVVGTFPSENISGSNAEFYCQSNHYLYVAGAGSSNVAVINTATDSVVTFVYAGGDPNAMAFDPLNHYLFVSDGEVIQGAHDYSTVSVISTLNNSYIESINSRSQNQALLSPFSIAYGNGNIYVASSQNGQRCIVEISGSSLTITQEVLTIPPIEEVYFQDCDLIALDSTAASYMVYNQYLSSCTPHVITGVSGITSLNSVSGNPGSPMIFLSYNASTSGGILATLINGTSILGHYTYSSGLYPYNLTYICNDEVSAILHNSSNPLLNRVSEISFITSSGKFTSLGNISLPTGLNSIIFNNGVKVNSGSSQDILMLSNYKLDDESLVLVTQGDSNTLSLYSTIYDNYFGEPSQALYDGVNNYLYVTNYDAGTVSVISPINCSLISTISLGIGTLPTYMAVNSSSGYVYVLESGNQSIAIIHNFGLLKLHPTISLKAGYEPYGIAYDQYTQSLFVSINNHFGSSSNDGFVCEINGFTNTSYMEKNGYSIGYVAFDGFNNQTYAILSNGNTYTVWNINSMNEVLKLASSGISGTYSITFDYLDGYMFAVFSSGDKPGQVQVYTPVFTLYSNIATGYDPHASVFDGGNNLLYVANYCATEGDNITVINAENFTVLTTIWVGSGPQNPAFDTENGYIYVPDNLSNKMTVINGGFTVYDGKPGVLESNDINSGGMIEASGNTQFITQLQLYNEGGFLIQNYSDQNSDSIVGSLPISVTNQSGELFFNFVDSGFSMPGSVNSKIVSSTSPTEAKMQVSTKTDSSYYVGDEFYLSDVFGNQYVAVVTGVFLEYFTVTMHTQFSSLINKYLYNQYNGTTASAPQSWFFSNIPLHVKAIGSQLTMTLESPVTMYSVSILFYGISVEDL